MKVSASEAQLAYSVKRWPVEVKCPTLPNDAKASHRSEPLLSAVTKPVGKTRAAAAMSHT